MATIEALFEIKRLAQVNVRLALKTAQATKKDWSEDELLALEKAERSEVDQFVLDGFTQEGRDAYDSEVREHIMQFRFRQRLDTQLREREQ